jgi:hypothetical protein
MQLTIKNVAKILVSEYAECPTCGGITEICSYYDSKDELQIKIFCDGCGTSANFAEVLVEIEKRRETAPKWKFWVGKERNESTLFNT